MNDDTINDAESFINFARLSKFEIACQRIHKAFNKDDAGISHMRSKDYAQ